MVLATELVNSRETFPLNLSEDIGEAVGRTTWSNPTDVGIYPVLTFDTPAGPECGRGPGKRLYEREGAGLEITNLTNGEIELQQPKASAAITGLKSHASSAPSKRQRKRKPVNAIDDLFQGLN